MWFHSVLLKTLRDYRVAILGWGLGIGGLLPLMFVSMSTILGDKPEAQANLLALVHNPAMRVFAEPIDVLDPGSYATWRLSVLFPLVSIWAMLAVTRTLRGEEEHGSLDVLLSVPRSRLRVVMEKLVATATALLLIGLLIGLLAFAGGRAAAIELGLHDALLFGLNIALFANVFGGLALVLSQFMRERRPAAGTAGALLGLSFVLTSAGRTVPDGEWIGRLSPLYYFELSKPLVPGHGASLGGMLVLAALSTGLSAIGVALFLRRDVGGTAALPFDLEFHERAPESSRQVPVGAWSLRSVFARSLRAVSGPTLSWGLGIAIYAASLTAILAKAQQNLVELLVVLSKDQPMYADRIAAFTRGSDVAANLAFLSVVFTMLNGMLAAFAVTLANRWAADEEAGRLEVLLGTPQPRMRVMLAGFGGVIAALVCVTLLILVSVASAAASVGMALDMSRLAQATLGMVPVGLVMAAIGYLLAGWLRAKALTGILIALLLASIVLTFVGRLFSWPEILLQLSIFEQYGTPLIDGLRVVNTLGLLAVAGTALLVALLRFARKDLAH